MRPFRPYIRRAVSVSQPPGQVSIHTHPKITAEKDCDAIRRQHPLTIMSANMWHDWPRQRRLLARAEKLAQLVITHEVDILLLQEVSRTPKLKMDEWMCSRLGMACLYARVNGNKQAGFEEGLAIFSRFPLSKPRLRQLDKAKNPFVRRLALGALVATPCEEMLAFSIHLGLSKRHNAAQAANLQNWIGAHSDHYPVLIGGDFNSHETSPQIRSFQSAWLDTFRAIHPHVDGATHELRWPWGKRFRRHRLDYIFLQPGKSHWRVIDTCLLQTPGIPYSDHHAVLTHISPY